LLGMEKFVLKPGLLSAGSSVAQWLQQNGCDWIKSPNQQPKGSADAAGARHHGDFSTDQAVLLATIARIAGQSAAAGSIRMLAPSASEAQSTRNALQLK